MRKHEAILICNGEIQNQKELAEEHGFDCSTGSDCEVILDLHRRFQDPSDPDSVAKYLAMLKGVWACILVDLKQGVVVVSRDRFGVRPLFFADAKDGSIAFSSVLAGLPAPDVAYDVNWGVGKQFTPGNYELIGCELGERIHSGRFQELSNGGVGMGRKEGVGIPGARGFQENVVRKLEAAVQRRMMADVPIGCFLSGGQDSSVVAAFVVRDWFARGGRSTDIHTFAVGMEGGTDLKQAEMVAMHLKTTHHTQIQKKADFVAAIPEVVRATETWDLTTVRASVGNWLGGKRIRAGTDVRVVFNGDGADEVCGGQMQFWGAPGDEEFDAECRRLVREIHQQDVLRSDRSVADHDLEARTPFLDHEFVEAYMSVPACQRRPGQRGCTKGFLREAVWAVMGGEAFLPRDVQWRAKEAFSDGVSALGDTWADTCEKQAGVFVGDLEGDNCVCAAVEGVTGCAIPGGRKEGVFQQRLFERYFGERVGRGLIPGYWMPRWSDAKDPSARVLSCQEGGGAGASAGGGSGPRE